jgi:hypothetical protein
MSVVLAELLAVLIVLCFVCGFTLMIVVTISGVLRGTAKERRSRHRREDLREARRTTLWAHYARPCVDSDEYEFGVERIWDGHVLDRKEIHRLPGNADLNDRLEWEGRAIVKAQEHNDAHVGMGGLV